MIDKQKASRCYEFKIISIREKQLQESREFTERLRKTGMLSQGPGYQAYIDLLAKHLKECAELHVDCDLDALVKNKKVGDETKTELLNRIESFVDALVAGYNSSIRSKIAADNLTGGIADALLNGIPHKSLSVRQYLRNKVLLMIDKHNEAIDVLLEKTSDGGNMKIKEIRPILTLVLYLTSIFGILLLAAGIILVYRGATGATEFSFLGQTFKSTNAGIAAFFMGAVLIAVNFRRVLTSLERINSK